MAPLRRVLQFGGWTRTPPLLQSTTLHPHSSSSRSRRTIPGVASKSSVTLHWQDGGDAAHPTDLGRTIDGFPPLRSGRKKCRRLGRFGSEMIVSVPAPPESRMFEERRFLKQNNQTRHSHCVRPRQTQVFPNFTS